MRSVFCLALLAATLLNRPDGSAQAKAPAGPAGANPAILMCKASDLSLGTDDENGAFNGMSHSGTLLVLRNLSPTACRVPQRPDVTFQQGKVPLAAMLEIPGAKFMHPGPVMVPVVIVPEAEVTSKLTWVAGEVYENSVCITPDTLQVKVGDGTQLTALHAHLCGDKAKGVTYQATPFVADPTLDSWKKSQR